MVRSNRDTLYSGAVFDLDAGPVTITLPDAGKRFRSIQVFDEDQYTPMVVCRADSITQCLVEQRLLGAVQLEQDFEFSAGARRNPIQFLTGAR